VEWHLPEQSFAASKIEILRQANGSVFSGICYATAAAWATKACIDRIVQTPRPTGESVYNEFPTLVEAYVNQNQAILGPGVFDGGSPAQLIPRLFPFMQCNEVPPECLPEIVTGSVRNSKWQQLPRIPLLSFRFPDLWWQCGKTEEEWEEVDPHDFPCFRSWAETGGPVLTPDDIASWQKDTGETVGHANVVIAVASHEDGGIEKQSLVLLNSWGANWGMCGFWMLSMDAAVALRTRGLLECWDVSWTEASLAAFAAEEAPVCPEEEDLARIHNRVRESVRAFDQTPVVERDEYVNYLLEKHDAYLGKLAAMANSWPGHPPFHIPHPLHWYGEERPPKRQVTIEQAAQKRRTQEARARKEAKGRARKEGAAKPCVVQVAQVQVDTGAKAQRPLPQGIVAPPSVFHKLWTCLWQRIYDVIFGWTRQDEKKDSYKRFHCLA